MKTRLYLIVITLFFPVMALLAWPWAFTDTLAMDRLRGDAKAFFQWSTVPAFFRLFYKPMSYFAD